MKRTAILVGAMALALGLAAAARAVEFEQEVVLAGEDRFSANVQMKADAAGQVDIVFNGAGGLLYSRWEAAQKDKNHGLVIDGEKISGPAHMLLGLARHKDVLRVGVNYGKVLYQVTRNPDGTWTPVKTDVPVSQYYGAVGGYDVNPVSGKGGFCILAPKSTPAAAEGGEPTVTHERLYVQETADGKWETKVLGVDQKNNARGDFVFTQAGQPIVAYQQLGKPSATLCGPATSPAAVAEESYDWFPLAVTGDSRGRVHLLVPMHTGRVDYYQSPDGGRSWTPRVSLEKQGGAYGDAVACDIAAYAPARLVAAVFINGDNKLTLAVSRDDGATWEITPTEAGAQYPAVAIDPAGRIYVAYNHTADKTLRLHVTAPLTK